jgi:hypothetical protein
MKSKEDQNILYKYTPFKGRSKAYIYWYIEMLKPENERDKRILDEKYNYMRSNIKKK